MDVEGDDSQTAAGSVENEEPVESPQATEEQTPATEGETSVGAGNEVAETVPSESAAAAAAAAAAVADDEGKDDGAEVVENGSNRVSPPPRSQSGDEADAKDGDSDNAAPEPTAAGANGAVADTDVAAMTAGPGVDSETKSEAEPSASAEAATSAQGSDTTKADEGGASASGAATAEEVAEEPAGAERAAAAAGSSPPSADKAKRHVNLPVGLQKAEATATPRSPETPVEHGAAALELAPIQRGKSFMVNYMGSTQLVVDTPMSKNMRITLAYEAASRVKQPEGEPQPLIPVHFFVSTECVKIIHRADDITLMDHPLRSISYVADIGRLVVVMARRRLPQHDGETGPDRKSKLLCHVLESDDAHHISETMGFAFNFARREFLAKNGIDEESLAVSDYADILSIQRMPHDELAPFIGKEGEDEFQLVKKKGEHLGFSVMESGWGSMIPTVTVSHLMKSGAAAKGNRINVGDQLLSVAGKSLVGIPVAECMDWLKSLRYLTMVKIKLVHTPPVVDVNIVRPDLKFPLGFSVLDGTVTSLLRGSIGERGGIRVGHHIIEINGNSTVNMKAEHMLDMLQTTTGHMRLKTMSLHLYRIMTSEVVPEYV